MPTQRKAPPDLWSTFAEQAREYAVMVIDRSGRISWWSPGAEEIFGHEASAILGEPTSRLFTPEDVAAGMDRLEIAVADAGSSAEDDRWMLRADGARFWASGLLLAVRDESGNPAGYVKLLRNRTELREQIDSLRNRVTELESDNKRKDIFFSTLSHELHNPLSPLTHAVRIVRDATGDRTPDVEYALRIVERQTEMLRRLVDDLLDFARMSSGRIELQRERVVLNEVVVHAVESVRPMIAQRRHALDVTAPAAEIVVDGDADRLLQVFVNLLTNAAKYTPPAGHIWVHATTEGQEAVVHVRDTGVGIPPDMLPRIFDLFTQVDTARAYSQGGLGIGLSLVKNFIDLHGGSVQVSSDGEGKGAAFSVRLPLRTVPQP